MLVRDTRFYVLVMERISLAVYLSPFYQKLAAFTQGPRWRLKVLGVCVVCVLLFQFPELQFLYHYAVAHTEPNNTYATFVQQVANPWINHSTEANSHESKMVFRLTVPLLARLLHLNVFGVLGLQAILGLAMLWALLTLIERITQDRLTASLLVLGTCFTYYGGAFLHDIYCLFDAFGYAVLVLMLLSRRPLVLYALSLAGCFLDERVLVASLLVVLWHSMRVAAEAVPTVRRPTISWAAAAVVAGWFTYGALRIWLTASYGLPTNGGAIGLGALRISLQREVVALGFITSIESYWLVVILALVVLVKQRQWLLGLAVVGACLPVFASAFLVHDITRSLAYCFPVVLIALVVLAHYFTLDALRQLALVIVVFAVLLPNYFYQFGIYYSESIFEKVFRFWMLHNATGLAK
ncbi:MAG: hypothetical protein EOO60_04890 [Hymenobacter sp.]|nr:MAG: hypothetical protein EOO60_04890 [Hymenobacter sp.]